MTNDTFPPEAAEGGVAPTIGRAADDLGMNNDAAPDGAEIAALCADLAGALVKPDYGTDTLRRQAQLLDHLLYSVMARKVDGGGDAWIDLVLKIQKQCMDTIKAISAVDYMQAITAPRPRPPQIPERTIKEGR